MKSGGEAKESMLELYTWDTPNGRKVSIMLEELALPYKVIAVDIGKKREQFAPAFLEISPNNKIPALVDGEAGLSLMESGAILMYLAEKTGCFMPAAGIEKWRVIEWLMLQMGTVGPFLGQAHHFHFYNPGKAPYAEQRYLDEAKRIYGVLDRRLAAHAYLAGDYSIADIATWPWIARHPRQAIDLDDYPAVKRWYLAIGHRPAVKRGWNVPHTVDPIPLID
jgi:GSH-dependent disulfide-bond oxidoreductase